MMDMTLLVDLILCLILVWLLVVMLYHHYHYPKRKRFIQEYLFPERVTNNLRHRYPHLNDDEVAQVLGGLRQYFLIKLNHPAIVIGMPSQVVDCAWHDFILVTQQYQTFCQQGLGFFLHHIPAEEMKHPDSSWQGIKEAWHCSCEYEGIDPELPQKLPNLFAIDARLNIPDGYHYTLEEMRKMVKITRDSGCGGGGCGGGGCGG